MVGQSTIQWYAKNINKAILIFSLKIEEER